MFYYRFLEVPVETIDDKYLEDFLEENKVKYSKFNDSLFLNYKIICEKKIANKLEDTIWEATIREKKIVTDYFIPIEFKNHIFFFLKQEKNKEIYLTNKEMHIIITLPRSKVNNLTNYLDEIVEKYYKFELIN